jgi:soluble lytic murein transglycosylase-like protein
VGAIGVMQIMPDTARDPNVNIPDIETIENNVHAGVKYLRFIRNCASGCSRARDPMTTARAL